MNVVELTKSLISCPSVTPNNEGVLDLLQKELTDMGFTCNRYLFNDTDTPDVDNLFAKIGSGAPHLCFGGHTDVVPVGDENAWSSNPFEATEKNGKLYGRGASDMKSAIAAFVSAVREYLENNQVKGTISLLITNDEEGPAINGTRKVLEEIYKNGEKIDSCLVGEPTCPNNLGEMIKIGRRGSMTTTVKVSGKQGHVAYPKQALNPILGMGKTLEELKNMEWDLGNENFEPTSFQVSNIKSGTGAENVVPGVLEMTFNFRFSPESSPNGLKEMFEEILKKSDLKYDVCWTLSALPFLTSKTEFIDIVKSSIKEISNIDTKIDNGGGTSDGRWVAPMGSEIVELGPLNKTIHQIDEHVDIEDLSTLKEIYKKILIKVHQSV